jgi:hypothetical protein
VRYSSIHFIRYKSVCLAVLLVQTIFIGACAPKAQVQSQPTLVEDTLYFGLSTPQGPVTPAQWGAFLSQEVTPRFPDGLTAWDAKGQWKDNQGKIGKEPTKVLLLIHPDSDAEDKAIQVIIDIYKKEFHQESVMRVRSRPEVHF